MIYLQLFALTLGLVFVKALQQRNVAHGTLGLIVPTSFLFAAVEVPTIGLIAKAFVGDANLLLLIAASGSAASIGCVVAVLFHQRLTGRR